MDAPPIGQERCQELGTIHSGITPSRIYHFHIGVNDTQCRNILTHKNGHEQAIAEQTASPPWSQDTPNGQGYSPDSAGTCPQPVRN